MSIHPMHHCGKDTMSDESGKVLFVRYWFAGSSFTDNVQAMWLQGRGVRAAKLVIGGELLGVSRVILDEADKQRLHFTVNDAALPLHLLRWHDVRMDLFCDAEPAGLKLLWQGVSWEDDRDQDETRYIYVETEKPEGAHNMWVFREGMAGIRFPEGFNTHRQLLQAHVKARAATT